MASGPELPALYQIANLLSTKYQSQFLWLIRAELFFLFVASVLSLDFYDTPQYYVIYAVVFLCAMIVLIYRSSSKPEQQWYRARAVSESIKTSAWRYMMRAHPYQDREGDTVLIEARSEFLSSLRDIVKANKILSSGEHDAVVQAEQISTSMQTVRAMNLDKRVEYYLSKRIKEQQNWYVGKARQNRKSFIRWMWASIFGYGLAIIISIFRVAHPEWKHTPIEPLIALSASVLAWVQIKKHSELAASYTLTATEIGIAREDSKSLTSEQAFSDFVNDTELAFSREHTQWVARQQTAG